MNFDNPLGWYALLALIPLVILYLRRPKSVDETVPSLMFFMKRAGMGKRNLMFRRFVRDLLFLIQVLTFAALAFALAAPYIEGNKTFFAQDTILVIDASASSQTMQGSMSRFDREISEAKSHLKGKVSIISAENMPVLVLEKGGRQSALQILSSMQPADTTSDIGEAMLLAADLVEKGNVVVLSDFIYTEGQDPLIAQRAITSKGAEIELVDVSGEADNTGIIDLVVGRHTSKVKLKNFNKKEKEVTLLISNQGKGTKYKRTIPARSVEIIDFETPAGLTKLTIEEKDDFMGDNQAFISSPQNRKVKTLLVTNREKSYLKTALLSSPDIGLSVYNPPVIPSLDFDVIIINEINPKFLVPGFFSDIRDKVSEGAALVITAQDNMKSLGFDLPVELNSTKGASRAKTKIVNQLTKDIDFGVVSKYYTAEAKAGAITLVEADDFSPLIAIREQDKGAVVYYGLFDDYSDFKTLTSYPIFWNTLMGFLTQTENINDYNTKTGRLYSVNEQKVKTPGGVLETNKVFLDRAGFYEFDKRTIAASLLNEKESDVSKTNILSEKGGQLFIDEELREKQKEELQRFIVTFILLMVLLEILYIKRRGDI